MNMFSHVFLRYSADSLSAVLLDMFGPALFRYHDEVREGTRAGNVRHGVPANSDQGPRGKSGARYAARFSGWLLTIPMDPNRINGWICSVRFSGGVALMSLQAERGHGACPQNVSTKRVHNCVRLHNAMCPLSVPAN